MIDEIAEQLYDLLFYREWEWDDQHGNCCISCGVSSRAQKLGTNGIPKHKETCEFVKAMKAFEDWKNSQRKSNEAV